MAQLGEVFDPNTVDDDGGFDPFPGGRYLIMMTDSELKDAQSGNGNYLKLAFQVQDGPMKGRLVWANITFKHINAQAQTIGQQQLKQLTEACEIDGNLTDTQQLHGRPIYANIVVEEGKDGYGPNNRIKKFMPMSAGPADTPPAKTATNTGKSGDGAKKPWEK